LWLTPALHASVAILWNPAARGPAAIEQQALENVLRLYGFPVERVGAIGRPQVLVVPATSPADPQSIAAYVRNGGKLVLCGAGDAARALGILPAGEPQEVKDVVDAAYPTRYLRWAGGERVVPLALPSGAKMLLFAQGARHPLAVAGEFGAGRFLFLATAFDTRSPHGLTRYPYFALYLEEALGLKPPARRPALEAYFDPAFRQGADLDALVRQWREWGIRIIYAAAWQDYDYPRLIDLCHRNGVAVYAWFVPPMITRQFWEQHPEWREKTASGADARIGWRYLMNLRHPEARAAAFRWFREQIESHDWDGINLAELNYDSVLPLADAARFAPMNDDVRREFQELRGFDPRELFDIRSPRYWERDPRSWRAFLDYRAGLVTELHRAALEALEPARAARGLEMIVTALDSLNSPRIRDHSGVDSKAIARLMKQFAFTLQVQDPHEFWAAPPERYAKFAAAWRKLARDPRRLMFDVNIVEDRDVDPGDLPSALATGTEFAATVREAFRPTGRAAVYSEFTVPPQDWRYAAAVLAAAHPARAAPQSPLSALSCNLLRFERRERAVRFEYESPGRCAVMFVAPPAKVLVDGRDWREATLPSGKHLVEVEE
jgi:hypothetical protein